MKKNIFSVLVMLLALCCLFVGCDNPAAPNSGNDGKDDINGGNEEVVKDWWLGTWYHDYDMTLTIDNETFSGIFRQTFVIEANNQWASYMRFDNKYVIIKDVLSEGKDTVFVYSFSNDKTPFASGTYNFREYTLDDIEKGIATYTHADKTTTNFAGKIEIETSSFEYSPHLYFNTEKNLLERYQTSANDNIVFMKLN